MNIKIAIVDSDVEYTERLAGVLQQYEELSVSIFSNTENFEKSLENNTYEIILFDADISDRQLFFPPDTMTVCLGSNDSKNLALYTQTLRIPKFQRISNMYKEIIKEYAQYAKDKGMSFGTLENSKVIAVYSPIGGSGKTVTSMILAEQLRRIGKKVLFLSLEQLNSSMITFPGQEEGMISLLEMLDNKAGFELKFKGILKENEKGIMYIEGFDRVVDYEAVDKEEIERVLAKIRGFGVCDYIIVDLGTTLDTITKCVLQNADKVVMVQKSGLLEDTKMKLFEKQLLFEELRTHMYVLQNFAGSNTKYQDIAGLPVIGKIHQYGSLQLADLLMYAGQENDLKLNMLF